MGTVALRFRPSPEHVRTARMIGVAVARRAGLDEGRMDEIRLAVGEVCARAVRRCQQQADQVPADRDGRVLMEVEDGGPTFVVTVTDPVGPSQEDPISLALVGGLSDDLHVLDGPGGSGGRVTVVFSRRPDERPLAELWAEDLGVGDEPEDPQGRDHADDRNDPGEPDLGPAGSGGA